MRLSISGVHDLPELEASTLVIRIHDPGEECPLEVERCGAQVYELVFHDVADKVDERDVPPQEWQLERLRRWLERQRPEQIHVHCFYGVSRSTAIACFALACLQPQLSDRDIVQQVLEARPQAAPNKMVLRLADQLLGRRLYSAWKRQQRY